MNPGQTIARAELEKTGFWLSLNAAERAWFLEFQASMLAETMEAERRGIPATVFPSALLWSTYFFVGCQAPSETRDRFINEIALVLATEAFQTAERATLARSASKGSA